MHTVLGKKINRMTPNLYISPKYIFDNKKVSFHPMYKCCGAVCDIVRSMTLSHGVNV